MTCESAMILIAFEVDSVDRQLNPDTVTHPSTNRARLRNRCVEGGGENWGGGVPLPNRLGRPGERRQLPQRGPGRRPGRQRIFGII